MPDVRLLKVYSVLFQKKPIHGSCLVTLPTSVSFQSTTAIDPSATIPLASSSPVAVMEKSCTSNLAVTVPLLFICSPGDGEIMLKDGVRLAAIKLTSVISALVMVRVIEPGVNFKPDCSGIMVYVPAPNPVNLNEPSAAVSIALEATPVKDTVILPTVTPPVIIPLRSYAHAGMTPRNPNNIKMINFFITTSL